MIFRSIVTSNACVLDNEGVDVNIEHQDYLIWYEERKKRIVFRERGIKEIVNDIKWME